MPTARENSDHTPAGGLRQRRLGRTGTMVAELGLGAMDTPHSREGAATLHAALDAGINVIDTARNYEGSEFLIGQVVRERRAAGEDLSGLFLASKTFSHTASGSQRDIDRSLSMLGVDRIDLYQLHDVSNPQAFAAVMGEDGALEGLRIAQYRGLIRHIGVSSHDFEVLRALIETGAFDTVMVEYSAFAPESAPVIDLAAERDVGVLVMRPLGGSGRTSVMRGRINEGYGGALTPANLLRYVLSHPAVSVAIPGARYPSRVYENVGTVTAHTEPMSDAERREIEQEASRLY